MNLVLAHNLRTQRRVSALRADGAPTASEGSAAPEIFTEDHLK